MGEVAKKKSATWRADAGSKKKKEKKEEERRWNSTKKKERKRRRRFICRRRSVETRHPFSSSSSSSFFSCCCCSRRTLFGRKGTSFMSFTRFFCHFCFIGYRVSSDVARLPLTFVLLLFFLFFLVCRLCVCLFPFDGRFFGWASDFRRLMFSSW